MSTNQVSFLRHNLFFGPEDVQDVTLNIIGVGATGSWVGLLAAKMGFHKFQVWDADLVESHNCPNQIYDIDHVGLRKVDAFEQVLKRFNKNVTVTKHNEFFSSSEHMHLLGDAVFIAVDSNAARKDIVSGVKSNEDVEIVFETAMGFEHALLRCFTPFQIKFIDNYLSLLKDDSEIEESACNARIITTLTNIVASSLVHILCDYYSSSRRKQTFKITNTQLFNLTNILTTYSRF